MWIQSKQHLLFTAWNTQVTNPNGALVTLWQFDAAGQLSPISTAGQIDGDGMAVDANDNVVVATWDIRGLAALPQQDPNQRRMLATQYDGLAFNSPNDLAVANDGIIYFTDPNYSQAGRPGQSATRVYRLRPDGSITVVDAAQNQPNGINLSVDQRTLYVGMPDGTIVQYTVDPTTGDTGPAQPFAKATGFVDGMTIDCAGNVYASQPLQNQVAIFSAAGAPLGTIPTPDAVSNVAFGGASRETLYLTVRGQLCSANLAIPGLPY